MGVESAGTEGRQFLVEGTLVHISSSLKPGLQTVSIGERNLPAANGGLDEFGLSGGQIFRGGWAGHR